MERRVPTKEEVLEYLTKDRNWGRWGDDDQIGAVNMVTPEKRAAAARLVKTGRAVSLSREFPKTPAGNNPTPAMHYMKRGVRGDGGDGWPRTFTASPTTARQPPTWTLCATSGTITACGTAATLTTS